MMKKFLTFFVVISSLWSCLQHFQGELYRIQENGKYGYIDRYGNVIIEPQYLYSSPFSEDGFALVISSMNEDDGSFNTIMKYGYINKDNKIVIDTINRYKISSVEALLLRDKFEKEQLAFDEKIYDFLEESSNTFVFQDSTTKLLGYKNLEGVVIVEPKYVEARKFVNGRAIVQKLYENVTSKTKYTDFYNTKGAIDFNGNIVIPLEYYDIQDFWSDGTTWTSTLFSNDNSNNNFLLDCIQIDLFGNILLGPITLSVQDNIENNSNYYRRSVTNIFGTYYTFYDKKGVPIMDWNHDGQLTYNTNENGKSELEAEVTQFSEGKVGVLRYLDERRVWLFADEKFNLVSEPFDSIVPFSEGMAAVKNLKGAFPWDRKWGFVNNYMKLEIPYDYDKVGNFEKGLAYFRKDGHSFNIEGYIDRYGNIVWQTKRMK